MTTKICTRCRQEKPLDDFCKAAKGRHGRNPECRICWAARLKAIRDANPEYNERTNIYQKEINDKTAKTATAYRKRWTKEEDDRVKEYWEDFSSEDIAVELGRTYHSIMWRAHSILNLPSKRDNRTETSMSE